MAEQNLNARACATLIATLMAMMIEPGGSKEAVPSSHYCQLVPHKGMCYSALAEHTSANHVNRSKLRVSELMATYSLKAVQYNQRMIHRLASAISLGERERIALQDCEEQMSEAIDEINLSLEALKNYPHELSEELAEDMKTMLSSAMTNHETCLEGLTNGKESMKLRGSIWNKEKEGEKACSNTLAMICNMTTEDMEQKSATESNANRKLTEKKTKDGSWPKWLPVSDRRLLRTPSVAAVAANVVVASDGSGDYRTISDAVAKAPTKSDIRYVIKIKAGVYRENVVVPKNKTKLMFIGEGITKTIITASLNVVDGYTTFHSATVAAVGKGFLARDLTIENTAGPHKHQAVALRVGSDLSAFYMCEFLGYQDTLYVHSNRQFYMKCLITGTVDFIFGNAAAVIQNCDIHARKPSKGQKNMVTAQGRVDPYQNTGIVIQNCRIGATSDLMLAKDSFPSYLGRPWKEYSRTVVMQSFISDVINPAGWLEWNGEFALNTLYYAEYNNSGPGSGTTKRIKWKGFRVLRSAAEAEAFTSRNFIGGASWLRNTSFPYALDL